MYKTPIHFSDFKSKRAYFPNLIKSENSSLRLTKSYYLYKDSNSKNSKLNIGSDSYLNSNVISSLNNLSTKYNSKERNVYNSNKKDFNTSIRINKFFEAPKFFNMQKINFNSTKNNLYFNKMTNRKLPEIKQMKKSSSVGNFGDKIKYNKKTKTNFLLYY